MGDILSKEEMESLLKAETVDKKADVSGKIVRPYDFHSPERFSKEHLRIFQLLAEGFSTRLKKHLSSHMRLEDLEINVNEIKQTIFKDFLSLPSPTYISVFTMQPLDGKSAIEIETAFLIFLMEYLLGGKTTEKPQTRELTQLEIEIANSLTNRILTCFSESFEKAVKFDSKIDTVESNPEFVVIASPNEAVLFLSLGIKLKGISGSINICLPYLVVESLIPYLNIKKWFMNAQKKSTQEAEEVIKGHLNNSKLDLICSLGTAEVTLRELCQLQEGDYIRLDSHKDATLELRVSGLNKFIVQPGLVGKRLAVKIVGMGLV